MLKAKLYNLKGEDIGEVKLNETIFGIEKNLRLIKQAVLTYLSNIRHRVAHSQGKGEVRGGGKKPWKQKGTGRARHGSIRSPLWRGGGVIFGPKDDANYEMKMNKKQRRRAMFMVLSDKAKDEKILVLEKLETTEAKTKSIAGLLKKLPLGKNQMLVTETMNENIVKSANNLKKTEVFSADSLNAYDLLRFEKIIFTKEALKKLEDVFVKK